MKKLYYFSKSSLQYVEIRDFKSKLTVFFGFLFLMVMVSGIIGYFLLSSVFNSNKIFNHSGHDNSLINDKLNGIVHNYYKINKELDSLVKVNNDLLVLRF